MPKVFAEEPPLDTWVKHLSQTPILFSLSNTLKYFHTADIFVYVYRVTARSLIPSVKRAANSLFGLAIKLNIGPFFSLIPPNTEYGFFFLQYSATEYSVHP